MPARLILNADDFGLTRGINRAIAELHSAEALTSATLMATGPAFDDAVTIAHAHPTLCVGCHIVLVDGTPLSHPADIPTLLGPDEKTFRTSLADFAIAALTGRIAEDDIAREAAAQVQHLQRAGIDVTHIDTHKHTHMFPAVTRPLLFVASRAGIGAIRNPFEPAFSLAHSTADPLRRLQVRALARLRPRFESLSQLRSNAIATTDGTLGIASTGRLNTSTLRAMLAALPATGTFELVLHPGYNDTGLNEIQTRLRASRDIERNALLEIFFNPPNPSTAELIHYGELGTTGTLRALNQHTLPTGYETIL